MNKKKTLILIGIIIALGISSNHFIIFRFYDKEFERAVRDCMEGYYFRTTKERMREFPIKRSVLRQDIELVGNIFIDLTEYDIKDFRDIKKFKNLESLAIGYVTGEARGRKIAAPHSLNAISELKSLKHLDLFSLKIESESFHEVFKGNVESLIIDKCEIDSLDFIKKIPSINHVSLSENNIPSLEFIQEMPNLKSLHLSHNQYDCSLDTLESSPKLEKLSIFDDKFEPFEQIPYISTIKELNLQDAGSPSKDEVEEYFSWSNLEKLKLNDGYYDMKTKTWYLYNAEEKKE